MYLARKCYLGTLFLRLLVETGPPFYVLVPVTRSFLSHFKTLSVGTVPESNPRPPAHQSSALPTELILLQIHEGSRNSSWSVTRATYLGRLLKLLAKRRLSKKPEADGALFPPPNLPPRLVS